MESLGEAVGQMYVEKYFPAAAKERMVAVGKESAGPHWENVFKEFGTGWVTRHKD